MVFVPTRDQPTEPHEPGAVPRRQDHVQPPSNPPAESQLRWRAVVHAPDREAVQTTWHMVACEAPLDPEQHCEQGRELMQSVGDPDGHCLIDGNCPRCAE
jgi:hypothetical protein